jgi:hypothetical protein
MKTILLIMTYFLAQNCSDKSTQVLSQKNLPVAIDNIYSQSWAGGRPESGSGINLYIKFKTELPKNIKLQKIYFQNKETTLNIENQSTFIASIYKKPNLEDMDMNGDVQKEYGNQIPEAVTNDKYELKPNEAIFEFLQDTKVSLYKITDIEEKPLLAYPSAKPDNVNE